MHEIFSSCNLSISGSVFQVQKFEILYNIDPSHLTKLGYSNTCKSTSYSSGVECSELEVNGKMAAIFNHMDNFRQGIDTNSLSYIKSLDIEQNKTEEKIKKMDLKLKLPADISQLAHMPLCCVSYMKF